MYMYTLYTESFHQHNFLWLFAALPVVQFISSQSHFIFMYAIIERKAKKPNFQKNHLRNQKVWKASIAKIYQSRVCRAVLYSI